MASAEVEVKLGRGKGEPRHISTQAREIDWHCGYCGCPGANQFTRDGHYKRNLETGWGYVQQLQVPMLECQQCHHDVICTFSILEKYQRFWIDLEQDILFSSGLGQSLRAISQEKQSRLRFQLLRVCLTSHCWDLSTGGTRSRNSRLSWSRERTEKCLSQKVVSAVSTSQVKEKLVAFSSLLQLLVLPVLKPHLRPRDLEAAGTVLPFTWEDRLGERYRASGIASVQ